MQTLPTIDLDTLTSKAITRLAENGPQLARERDAFAESVRENAKNFTKKQLTDMATDANPHRKIKSNETLPTIVDVAVEEMTRRSDPAQGLQLLEAAARADRMMAKAINNMIEGAQEGLARLTPQALRDGDEPDVFDHGYTVQSNVDGFLVAEAVARYALRVVVAVNRGADIREVSVKLAKQALTRALSTLKHIANNGLATTRRAEQLYEGLAAEEFLRKVGRTYGLMSDDEEDLMVNLGVITFG